MRANDSGRREFLRIGGRTVLGMTTLAGMHNLGLLNAFAAGADYKALVCVFLFGGNDSNNTVVPLDSTSYDAYRRLRGALALPATRLVPVTASGGRGFGFHEGLRDLATLYGERRVGVVANMGTLVRPVTRDELMADGPVPAQLFSHEDQIAQMQSGFPGPASTGWGGRAIDRLLDLNGSSGFPPAISMSGGSLFLVGEQVAAAGLGSENNLELKALQLGDENDRTVRTRAHQEILQLRSGLRLVQEANAVRMKAAELEELLRTSTSGPPLTTAFPDTGLGQQLKEVIRFVQLSDVFGLSRQVFFCSIGGFDTHSDQDPQQARLLAEVGAAVAAFYRATEELGVADKVTTFTESDFSRTLNPSGSGTDHAWGSHHFVVGGAVRGGELYGSFPALQLRGPDDAGDRGVWIPRIGLDQYGATLAAWFGVPDDALDQVFPNLRNFQSRNLGFV
jgi:uncharacterized protein (DUF1501 family)